MDVRRQMLVTGLVVVGLTISLSPGAAALSCAGHQDGSPTAIAAGHEDLAGDSAFFATWHHLLLARVVGVTTDDDQLSPTYGRTWWEVEVAAALGEGAVPSRLRVAAGDPGWLQGYAFTVGDAFAIPVWEIEELGYWSSFTCDPITQLGDLGAAVEEVSAVATAHATPMASVVPAAGGGPERASDARPGWKGDIESDGKGAVAAMAVVAVVVTGGGSLALRRRRQADADRSPT